VQPVEVYNLGAQSHVRVSFDAPEYTVDAVGVGVLRLLEAIRDYQKRTGIEVRFYQAGSSEMFGKVMEVPQKETTPFYPRSPYAVRKFTVTGKQSTIGNPTTYLPVTAFYLTMNPPGGEKLLSRAKLPALWPELLPDNRKNSI